MNPHYGTYYDRNESSGPVETESPNPIKFLAVKEGCTFVFRCFLLPHQDKQGVNTFTEEDRETVHKMFQRAFTGLGFGGKTAIGYGRFKEEQPKKPEPAVLKTYDGLELGKEYEAELTGKNNKGNWQAKLIELPAVRIRVSNIPVDKKIKDKVTLMFKKDGDPKEFECVSSNKGGR
jgi:CRISPR-associated protein Cmr6